MYSEVGRAGGATGTTAEGVAAHLRLVGAQRAAFCEELEYNLLLRWFLDMNLMERSFDPTVFTKEPPGAVVGRALQRGRDADRGSGQQRCRPPRRPRTWRPWSKRREQRSWAAGPERRRGRPTARPAPHHGGQTTHRSGAGQPVIQRRARPIRPPSG